MSIKIVSIFLTLQKPPQFNVARKFLLLLNQISLLVFNPFHEEPHKVPLLITLSDGCYAQFPVIILPPISCRLAGVRLAVIDRDFHRGDETILNFATVW